MTSFLEKIFKWAKCKHEKLSVLGFMPNQDAYVVKCAQCGEMRKIAKEGVVQSKPFTKEDGREYVDSIDPCEEVKDYDPQY